MSVKGAPDFHPRLSRIHVVFFNMPQGSSVVKLISCTCVEIYCLLHNVIVVYWCWQKSSDMSDISSEGLQMPNGTRSGYILNIVRQMTDGSWALFRYKDHLSRYMDFSYNDNTVMKRVLSYIMGISIHCDKMTSLYSNRTLEVFG